MKKFLIIFTVLFAALMLTGCNNDANDKLVAVSLDSNDTYRIQWLAEFKKQAEAEGYTVISTNADRNASKQISDIEGLVLQKPIAIFAHLNTGADEGINAAANAGIPVIAIDFEPAADTKHTTLVRDGQYIAGTTIGDYLKAWLEADSTRVANIGYVVGMYNEAVIARRDGIYDIIGISKKAGATALPDQYVGQSSTTLNAVVLAEQNANWSGTEAQTIVDAWLSAHPTMNVIIGMSDQIALGIIESLKTANKNLDDYLVMGVDGSDDARASLALNELDMTVARDIVKEVRVAFETMKKIVAGETVPKIVEPLAMYGLTKEGLE